MNLLQTTEIYRLLADVTRLRLLALVEREELTVAELVSITRLSQSRISSHLGKLREAGLVRDRRVGTSTFYALNGARMPAAASRAWAVLRKEIRDPLIAQDATRIAEAMQVRGGASRWEDGVAGNMERHYSPGRSWEAVARALLGLARLGDVLDVASGDSVMAELMASRSRSVTCIDICERVVRAGRRRLAHLGSVRFQRADMHALPFGRSCFGHALLMNALAWSPDPQQVLREVARVLAPGGDLVMVSLRRHNHRAAVRPYDHRNLGHEPQELRELLERNDFIVHKCAVTSRERRAPHFEVITTHAHRSEE